MNGSTESSSGVVDTAVVMPTIPGTEAGTIVSNGTTTTTHKPLDEDGEEKVFSNSYASKKTIANSAMNFALFMANVSQLKVLVKSDEDERDSFFVPLIVLITFSFIFQIIAAVVLIALGMKKKNTSFLNNVSVFLVLFITAINLVISGLGITYDKDTFSPFHVSLTNGSLTIY